MTNARTLLIVGASGAAATRVTERALATPNCRVVGLSRRRPEGAGDWLMADLNDPAGLQRALAQRPDITHLVYASRAPFGEGGVEDVPANLAMLRNLLDAAESSLPRFAHLHMIHGGKWYGLHIGPFRTPAREEDPRHLPFGAPARLTNGARHRYRRSAAPVTGRLTCPVPPTCAASAAATVRAPRG